jgi:hypothetical protein
VELDDRTADQKSHVAIAADDAEVLWETKYGEGALEELLKRVDILMTLVGLRRQLRGHSTLPIRSRTRMSTGFAT